MSQDSTSKPEQNPTPMTGEKCEKCGEYGEDRRTLWMSCLYAMEELGIPFEQKRVEGKTYPFVGMKELDFLGHKNNPNYPTITAPQFSPEPDGSIERNFYTLRVCKQCRGDWMQAIKAWFGTPVPVVENCGSGIFVREYGKLVEISLEEWKRRKGDKVEP